MKETDLFPEALRLHFPGQLNVAAIANAWPILASSYGPYFHLFLQVKKGGIPDKDSAARAVLKDWNSGVIKYFSAPPADTAHLLPGAAAIVSGFAASFDPATMMAQVLS